MYLLASQDSFSAIEGLKGFRTAKVLGTRAFLRRVAECRHASTRRACTTRTRGNRSTRISHTYVSLYLHANAKMVFAPPGRVLTRQEKRRNRREIEKRKDYLIESRDKNKTNVSESGNGNQ